MSKEHRILIELLAPAFLATLWLGVSCIFVCGGCSHKIVNAPDTKLETARLSETDAIRIAQQATVHVRDKLSNYEQPDTQYQVLSMGNFWWVFFEGKASIQGGGATIRINDRTRALESIPNM